MRVGLLCTNMTLGDRSGSNSKGELLVAESAAEIAFGEGPSMLMLTLMLMLKLTKVILMPR